MTAVKPDAQGRKRTPWIYIPSAYFAEGVPYVIVNITSVIMYKNMGVPNSLIGLTSLLYFPWVIKMFWGPFVDIYLTKRIWIILTQSIMSFLLLGAALGMSTDFFFTATIIVFILIAFTSATHDIATDGFYMLALSKKSQAYFVGIRSLFYRIAMWFGQGFIVIFTGLLIGKGYALSFSWLLALGLCSLVFLLLVLFHSWYLPHPSTDVRLNKTQRDTKSLPYLDIFRSYFTQAKILPIVAFILLYRFGEGMLTKMASPFLLDEISSGGLQLSNTDIGLIQGTIGLMSLIVGGILGGLIIAKFGLHKCILPMALALNIPDLFYIFLAYAKPSIAYVYLAVSMESFGYGLGFTSFTVFLMYISKGKYKTSHFAISTGLMALGMMIPGSLSGLLQEYLGYLNFFIAVFFLTIPGMITIFFIPLKKDEES